MPVTEIKKMFGELFASRLLAVKTGEWQGPVQSGDGSHVFWVTERIDGHLPALADIRSEVQREWSNAKRLDSEEKLYQALLRRYTVRIEQPEGKKLGEVCC